MANQREPSKRLIGAQAAPELWDGVDAWLQQHPGETTSDFVLAACMEKLEREGIETDRAAVLRDRRARQPEGSGPARPSGPVTYRANSKRAGAGKRILGKAAASVAGRPQ